MENKNFEKGETVYNTDGVAGEIVTELVPGEGWLVRPLMECYDDLTDEPYTERGSLQQWPIVFRKPPVLKKHEEITRLDKILETKKEEVKKLQATANHLTQQENKYRSRLTTLSTRNEALKRIEDFLDGKITHYAISRSTYNFCPLGTTWRVLALSDASANDEYSKQLRLFSLYGKSNGDLTYRLNRYSDGSGSTEDDIVIPCFSYEEALEACRERTNAQLENWRNGVKGGAATNTIYTNLLRLEMSVPDDLLKAVTDARKLELELRVNTARQALEKAEQDLADISLASITRDLRKRTK